MQAQSVSMRLCSLEKPFRKKQGRVRILWHSVEDPPPREGVQMAEDHIKGGWVGASHCRWPDVLGVGRLRGGGFAIIDSH